MGPRHFRTRGDVDTRRRTGIIPVADLNCRSIHSKRKFKVQVLLVHSSVTNTIKALRNSVTQIHQTHVVPLK
jgi:hypothetical protein